ncbi:(2Fe-2S)-binding protein [Myxococcota bacterium]|nr:(2Fe-2S)-binding protein [Myxococcota bacterium]MCZ7617087.1 2Fe-2S iron-sulfur cluster-binding protein [Myxococcota bacterium]
MPKITVDGASYEVAEGRTILQALDDQGVLMNGVDIPHYCWHPKLSIDGSCRLCQVEIEGIPKLQIACNTPVRDGMVIHTRNERVEKAREGVMELLLINHPLDCPICDKAGECKLQDYAFEYGVPHARTREPRRAGKKRVDLGPTIVFDQERCILCRRCVRFCREVPGTGELSVFSRGDQSVIETFPGEPLDNDYSMNVADICPVGALTTKDFRFKIRVWFLEDVPGICTGCAKGCNVHLGVANNRVYRYVPRRNDAVNGTWICDEGRLSYARIGADDRIAGHEVRQPDGRALPVSIDVALEEAAERLRGVIDRKGAGAVGILASPHATNEDLFVARRLLEALGSSQAGVAVRTGRSDALLIQPEKAANAEGCRRLGFGPAEALLERARGGAVAALLVLGHDALATQGPELLETLRGLDVVLLADSHRSELERVAQVVFATRVVAEKHGTLTNHAGRVQRVVPAVEPSFDAHAEGEIMWRLGRALGLPGFDGAWDLQAVSKALAETVPAFAGIDLASVPPDGVPRADR